MTFPHAMLRGLKPNWNSYGAPAIDERCIQKAYELWRQLAGEWQVVPCNDGGVQLERHRDGFDIEITISASSQETAAESVTIEEDAGMGGPPPPVGFTQAEWSAMPCAGRPHDTATEFHTPDEPCPLPPLEMPEARAHDWCDNLPKVSSSDDGSIVVTDLRGKTVKTPF